MWSFGGGAKSERERDGGNSGKENTASWMNVTQKLKCFYCPRVEKSGEKETTPMEKKRKE